MKPSAIRYYLRCGIVAWSWWQLLLGCCAGRRLCRGLRGSEKLPGNLTSMPRSASCCLTAGTRKFSGAGWGRRTWSLWRASTGARSLLEHELPQSRVLDELTLSLWVRSNRAGAVLALRIVFPNQMDQNGKPLTTTLEGDSYTDTGSWQLLKCQTTDRKMARKLQLLRYKRKSDVVAKESYVDRAFWPWRWTAARPSYSWMT